MYRKQYSESFQKTKDTEQVHSGNKSDQHTIIEKLFYQQLLTEDNSTLISGNIEEVPTQELITSAELHLFKKLKSLKIPCRRNINN